ncbi:hypothetical protein [Streptomyces sp900116325]|uniref:hypothetical protein n=1 Tax=Streptomyces sp. 900116325 TaxID=3154295 RepID=UPI00340CD2E8
MARKKSSRLAAEQFIEASNRIWDFTQECVSAGLGKQAVTWAYEMALIKIALEFEKLMLGFLVAAVNRDSSTFSAAKGVDFPPHMNQAVCEYLITGGGFFDVKDRGHLLGHIKKCVGADHPLYAAVAQAKYRSSLDLLMPLRNFAAHESPQSKKAAKAAAANSRMSSAGAHIKIGSRLWDLMADLERLANDIADAAPY